MIDSRLLVIGGTSDAGDAFRDGALLRTSPDGSGTWESVPDVPREATPVAQVVWTGRQALVFSAPSPATGEVRVHGWYPARDEWSRLPSLHTAGARTVAAAADGDTVAAWTGGGDGAAVLGLFDAWQQRWRTVPAPLEARGQLGVTLVGGDVAVWAADAGGESARERGAVAAAAWYEVETARWSALGQEPGEAAQRWPAPPPMWTGNELLLLHAAVTWRPPGVLPRIPEDTGAVVHVASADRLRSLAVDGLEVRARELPLTPAYPGRLLLRGDELLARRDGETVQAIPVVDDRPPRDLDGTMALPAADDGYWLLRWRGRWEAVAVEAGGTPVSEAAPLPEDSFPIAGVADGIVVTGPGEATRLFHPSSRRASWSVDAQVAVVGGQHRLVTCAPAQDGAARQRSACDTLVIVATLSGAEQRFTDARFDGFWPLEGALSPGDETLAIPVTRGEAASVAILGGLAGQPRVEAIVPLEAAPEAPLAWHPGGRWLLAGVQQRLLAIDASSGTAYDTGLDLPRPPYELAVGGGSP